MRHATIVRSLFVLLICQAFAGAAFGQVATFQQGAAGYTGCRDTWIEEGTGDNSADVSVRIDLSGPGWDYQGLIKFGEIFTSEGGPIPDGVQIISAALSVGCNDPGSGWMFHRMLLDWDHTDTWQTAGSPTFEGVTEANAEYFGDTGTGNPRTGYSGVDAIVQPVLLNTDYVIDLTLSVQAWSDGTTPNYGWVVHSYGSSRSGFHSSDAVALADRPLLTVEYPVTHNLTVQSTPILRSAYFILLFHLHLWYNTVYED